MAIYTYRCRECGKTDEVVQSISSYCKEPLIPGCCDCQRDMERYFTKPMVTFDTAPWAAYKSPIDGTVITGKAEQREHMARHGVVLYDEIAPDIERNRKQIAAEAEQQRKNDIIEAVKKVEAGYKPKMEKPKMSADVDLMSASPEAVTEAVDLISE